MVEADNKILLVVMCFKLLQGQAALEFIPGMLFVENLIFVGLCVRVTKGYPWTIMKVLLF